MQDKKQNLPIRLYRGEGHLVIAAPMPGLEPQDIRITVSMDKVVLSGSERGPKQHLRDLIISEWSVGPYYREVELPERVNPSLVNATYGNGIVVVSMPLLTKEEHIEPQEFTLTPLESTRGEHVGHSGKDMTPVDMSQRAKK
ncbi:heat shock protein Hsp20 [Thermobaculum terrenum ATCC BAA-798]|uniref:Heat shock protein Hsp20 n=1 Tax=Thermobaculum terrenum (strain ATCC BAA-798 / CCMEE 7001 / YNP1) TaxID=525904 RepID=D1CED8_THET1|nr:Hsp20/alpha crystallin family protein [Thermobaculum terrenum]ACZ41294.1 heat shock protein Hsp20 [Thermobaculum terrenum ATCC BAA-798]